MMARENDMDEQLPPGKFICRSTKRRTSTADMVDMQTGQGFTIANYVDGRIARYMAAAVNDCTAAGLSVEDLEAGAVARLVRVMRRTREYVLPLALEYTDWAGILEDMNRALAALDKETT